jgi:polyhydroxyalkanoate synthesis regulator phasin
MRDALKSYLALASGLTDVSRQRAVAAAKALVSQGEATAEQVTTLAEDLLAQSRSNREAVSALVRYELDRTLGRVGLASNDEVGELSKRIRELEAQIRTLQQASGTKAPAKRAPAKKAPAKRPGAKKSPTTKRSS